ncbi:DUF742 domain-containing protein [Luteipulveratus mongoliensis]|uniref:DUF742 domain-containing protein n=1 Tax=Luteipulveratus mongoliensis TaxID=571913 RepID=A0A0K1JF51_9MICO|nr:DUF742 domain-containing protein [Luteipulveratus mongoliensis]AKU15203.1 hypothetical protein VV02_03880 [Luteipulveratus mongoliensis]
MATRDPAPEDDAPQARIVRPYALTSGRTRANVDLPVEATLQLQPSAWDQDWPEDDLTTRIVAVCEASPSVAEVSAKVGAPLGVVRVLLGDLIESGHIRVQTTLSETSSVDERHDLIERTLRGLRAI